MRADLLSLHLRSRNTHFGAYVGGAVELDKALANTLMQDMAFVIPLDDVCPANTSDAGIAQTITERFAVVVALGNDSSSEDKTGMTAYNKLHNIRSELFRALVGWNISGAAGSIYYAGGKYVLTQNSYIWWEFDFEYEVDITQYDGYCDIAEEPAAADSGYEVGDIKNWTQDSQLQLLNYISSKYLFSPEDERLPWPEGTPIADISLPAMETWIDLTVNPDDGDYDRGFGSEFDFYRILNRRNDPK